MRHAASTQPGYSIIEDLPGNFTVTYLPHSQYPRDCRCNMNSIAYSKTVTVAHCFFKFVREQKMKVAVCGGWMSKLASIDTVPRTQDSRSQDTVPPGKHVGYHFSCFSSVFEHSRRVPFFGVFLSFWTVASIFPHDVRGFQKLTQFAVSLSLCLHLNKLPTERFPEVGQPLCNHYLCSSFKCPSGYDQFRFCS